MKSTNSAWKPYKLGCLVEWNEHAQLGNNASASAVEVSRLVVVLFECRGAQLAINFCPKEREGPQLRKANEGRGRKKGTELLGAKQKGRTTINPDA
jgi:hypothetical protein